MLPLLFACVISTLDDPDLRAPQPGDGAPTDTAPAVDTEPPADTDPGTDTETHDTEPPGETGTPYPATCDELLPLFHAETADIRSCTTDADCGEVLEGTSCGCTRNWVANLDAELGPWRHLFGLGQELGCDLGTASTCDCPATDGFACVENTCTWDYIDTLDFCMASDGDDYRILHAALDGDDLTVAFEVSGGCEDHDYTLCWPSGGFLESYPVQATLEIVYDSHDDPCDGLVTDVRHFDLAYLKYAYAQSYGDDSGTILVHVGDHTLTYTF